ncbi:hypothetical protein M5D96_001957 [Drosophila gunungcola]|uniref:Uncharacterized protein n=1 Tax=Drosophila gunungcola TaxID=103775 RepID=A0A9Q0BVW7_9MUSC|nr:hypothetical protein M5D96_001957 [Drosophila gunungcola]
MAMNHNCGGIIKGNIRVFTGLEREANQGFNHTQFGMRVCTHI